MPAAAGRIRLPLPGMRRNYPLVLSSLFWLTMVVGFSDNWLYDLDQPSNSAPHFLIHAGFAFLWFSALVVQCALVRALFGGRWGGPSVMYAPWSEGI